MKVIIAGCRNHSQYDSIEKAMEESGFTPTEIVSGHARGVDTLGELWAHRKGIPVKVFPADWAQGLSAGHARNKKMAAYVGQKGALVAIWDGRSSGTKNMIEQAKKWGMQVHIHWVN